MSFFIGKRFNRNVPLSMAWFASLRSRVVVTLLLAILAISIYVHVTVAGFDQSYVGWLAPLDRIFDLALSLFLIALAFCVGRSICRFLSVAFANFAEELAFSIFLGTGTVGLAVLFFGLLGLLSPWPIVILILLFLMASWREGYRFPELIRIVFRTATSTSQRKALSAIGLCIIAVLIVRTAVPPYSPDESIYHLAVTSDFARAGKVFPSYDNSLGNLPFLIHMIYALCLLARSDIAAKLFSLFLALITAVSLYGFCARFLTRRIGAVALFAFFAAGMIMEVAVTTRIDVSLAGMLFLTTYAMMNYLATRGSGWVWVSAILGGFSLGIKPSAAIWLIFLGLMYLVETVRSGYPGTHLIKFGLLYTVIAAAVASPWYAKNHVWFGNPVYPMFTGEVADFGSWGVRYFDATDERKLDTHFIKARADIPDIALSQQTALTDAINGRVKRHPMRLWEFFTRPTVYLMGEPLHYPNYLFLLLPAVIITKPPRQLLWLLGMSLAFLLVMTWTVYLARFLVPAYPALTILLAYVVVSLSKRLKGRIRFSNRLPTYAVAIALTAVLSSCVFALNAMNTMGFLSGKISRRDFLLAIPSYRAVDFINRETPRDARIMCLGVQVNYEIQREHLADETWFQTKWRRLLIRNDSLEKVNEDLKRQGYTHILYHPELLEFAAASGLEGAGGMGIISQSSDTGTDAGRELGQEYQLLRSWTTFTLYRLKFLETVYADANGYEVLRIR